MLSTSLHGSYRQECLCYQDVLQTGQLTVGTARA